MKYVNDFRYLNSLTLNVKTRTCRPTCDLCTYNITLKDSRSLHKYYIGLHYSLLQCSVVASKGEGVTRGQCREARPRCGGVNRVDFWATVCKTVRPMLSDRCPVCVCLPCLSVTLVHCGQTVAQIKMKLGTQIVLGPGHIVLDGDSAPLPQRGTAPTPIFDPYLLQPNGCMDQDATC